jgi:hypothetical protein
MPSAYTSLLGFVQPTTGELQNTWGGVVNLQLTQLVEDAIAGGSTQSVAAGDWTLTTTGGGAANEARTAILVATGSPGTTRNIYAPKKNKTYVVVNNSDSTLYIKGGPTSPTTGILIAAGTAVLVAWDSTVSDFVKVAGGSGGGATGGSTGGGTVNAVFYENDQAVTVNYTITSNKNAGTFGPITIDSGITVTVPSGVVWTVV